MEPKKSKKANLERFRVVLFQTGLVVSLLLVIITLSWTFRVENKKEPEEKKWEDFEYDRQMLEVKILKEKTVEKIEKKKAPSPDVVIEKDEADLKHDDEEKKEDDTKDDVIPLGKTTESSEYTDPPRIDAQIMPAYKRCALIADENSRRACTEMSVIKEISDKLKNKNRNQLSGTVFISFVVDKKGKVVNVELLSGIDPVLDQEVVKAVQSLNDFEPASNNGLPAAIKYTLPVSFKIR